MSAKQGLQKLIKEIRRDSTPSNHQTWQNIWFDLDYDQKNELCSSEGWEYVTKFLELLSSEKLTPEGIAYIFEYILSIARTSEGEDYPAPINFDITTISEILLEQKKNLHDQNRAVRLDIINKGVEILDKMNNLQAIKTLVQFVKPNLAPGTYEIENRVTEFTLKSIKSLIIYASEEFSHKQYKSRNSTELSPELRSLISETMLAGHINDNSSELIVYCNCSLDSRELHLEDFSENKKKRSDLLDSLIADEISHSEYTKSVELIPESPECSVCGNYPDKAHICADCDALICERCAKAPDGKLWNREYALEIILYLECEETVASVIHFVDSEYTDEVSIILEMMNDYWKPEYLDKVTNLTKSNDIWLSIQAIRMIGNYGGKEHVDLLLDLLEKYAKLKGKGHKNARDAVEEALFDLRDYAHDDIVHISAETFHSKGYLNAINRIIKKIARVAESRPKSPNDWSDFRSWRSNKGEEVNQPYLPAILINDAISKIIDRQPIDFIELLEVDGVSPSKVAKYGHELLEIIRKNQPGIDSSQHLLPPWSFPNVMDEWLDSVLIHADISEWEDFEYPNQQVEFLKMKKCHTKSQLRELSLGKFEQFEDNKEILFKILDWRLEYKPGVKKAGRSRGVRYIIVK
jgi:hypothetical protein